jgi:hypothetical protein
MLIKVSRAMNIEQTGSDHRQSNMFIRIEEIMTPIEPSASATTCRNMPCISGFENTLLEVTKSV